MDAMNNFPHPKRRRNRNVLLSGGVGVAQRFAQLASAVITLPLVLHSLGEAGFGVWGAATSLAWAAGILDLGMGSALVTLVPQALNAGGSARACVGASLLGGTAISATLLLGGLAVVALRAHGMSPPFIIAGLALTLNLPLGIAGNIWFGLQKGYISAGWDLVQTALMLGFILLSAWAGAGVTAMVASVYGAMVLANAGSLIHLLATQPAIRPQAASLAVLRHVLASGIALSAISMLVTAGFVFDNVLALQWLGADGAARMTIAMRLCVTAAGFLNVATQGLWPAFVEAVGLDDHPWVLRTLLRGTLAMAALAGGGSALIIAFGAPVLRWWLHKDLDLPGTLFLAMGAWITVQAMPRVAGLLLNAVSALRGQVLAQAAATAASLGLKFLAAKQFGVAGILGATPLVWVFIVWPSYAWLAARWINGPGAPHTAPKGV